MNKLLILLPALVWSCGAFKTASADDLLKTAIAAESTGSISDAIAGYQAAIKQKPKYGEAWFRLGRLYLVEDSIPQAIDKLTRAQHLKYDPERTHLLLGRAYGKAGQFSRAEIEFGTVLESQPRSVEALTLLADIFLEKGMTDEAFEGYRRALAIDSTCALAHLGIAHALARQRKDDEAFAEYDAALRFDPGLAPVHLGRADLQMLRRKFNSAIEELNAYTEKKPRDPAGFFALARAHYGLANVDKALDACRKARQLGLASEEFLNLYGRLAYSAKAYAEAATILALLVQTAPGDAQRSYDLAKAYYHAGRAEPDSLAGQELLKKSVARFNEALTLDPTITSDIYFDLGLALYQTGQYDSAVSSFTRKIERDTAAAGAYFNRALSHSQAKRYPQAVADLLAGIGLQPKYVPGRVWLAQHYYFLKDYDRSRRECNKILELDPANKDARDLLKNIEIATKPKLDYYYNDY